MSLEQAYKACKLCQSYDERVPYIDEDATDEDRTQAGFYIPLRDDTALKAVGFLNGVVNDPDPRVKSQARCALETCLRECDFLSLDKTICAKISLPFEE